MNYAEVKNTVEAKMLQTLAPNGFNEYYRKFLFSGAKMLRPFFVYCSAEFLNFAPNKEILNLAAGLEFLHSATLIHDDILDDATLRRGVPCLYSDKGYKAAVLAGDYLLAAAMEIISEIKAPEIFKIVANSCSQMAGNEIEAFNDRFKMPDLKLYFERSAKKTAPLFLAGVKGTAVIAHKTADKNLLKFTENFALCFQIRDDLNNATGTDKNKVSNDKLSGIYTLADILSEGNSCDKIKLAEKFLAQKVEETTAILKDYPDKNKVGFTFLLNLI